MLSINPVYEYLATPPYAWLDNCFTDPEMDLIKNYCYSLEMQTAAVGVRNANIDSNVRKSNVSFFKMDPENSWFFTKLLSLAEQLNDQFYQFNLHGLESIQYTEYKEIGQKYDFHMDIHLAGLPESGLSRKLSFVLCLTDPSEYKGGEFLICVGSQDPQKTLVVEQPKARLFVFPSFMVHSITPITFGCRRSLVGWILGPKFK